MRARLVLAVMTALLASAPSRPAIEGSSSSNAADPDGTTALHWAVYKNDADLVTKLIKDGANVNAVNEFGATPMSEAAVASTIEAVRHCEAWSVRDFTHLLRDDAATPANE